jgi:DNA-binding transcriptional ArsR family regulator
MPEDKYITTVDFFKALSHPARLQILELLRPGERCVCEIFPELDMIQPSASRHLSIMKKEGLLQSRKDGLKVIYRVSDPRVFELIDRAAEITRQIWQEKAALTY